MFESRLKVILGIFGLALAVILVRLVDLQMVRAEQYRRQAEEALLYEPHTLPFVRGRILDRLGNELAADYPCWEVAVDYDVLAMEPSRLRLRARRLIRRGDLDGSIEEAEYELHRRIERTWRDLSRFSGESVEDLLERARRICRRIERMREVLEEHHGYDFPIEEERAAHPVLTGLDDQQQVDARQLLHDYPWVKVRDSTDRYYHASPSLPHVLGQLGAVTAATLREDQDRKDPQARYLATEKLGVSGIEHAAERRLRGRRGRIQESRAGETVERTDAENGRDVRLTLRLDLQEALYDLLDGALPRTAHPAGGVIAVLDVPTREVLAVVSYPGYDNNAFRQDYDALATDIRHQPLRFRAMANAYAPGSIVKPLTCAAGLGTGRITLDTTFECRGHLLPDQPDRWRCWPNRATGRRMQHGPLTVPDAIAHSCNIFMYQTGQVVGVQGLCNYFDMAGIGRPAETGLREEARGINPTPSWIASRGGAVTPGMSRLFAIGQGEVSITPLRAANLMAVYASGVYRPVTLIRDNPPTAEWRLPVTSAHWRTLRMGLFRVTNQPGATAYRTAHLVRDGHALCGKTGSATVYPWPLAYTIPYTTADGDAAVAVVPGNSKREALERFRADYGNLEYDGEAVAASAYWPPLPPGQARPSRDDQYEHAWFIAYLQRIDDTGRPMLDVTPRLAFSVLVEFGGSGGRAAGPIAVQAAGIILDVLGPTLDPDAVPRGPGEERRGWEPLAR